MTAPPLWLRRSLAAAAAVLALAAGLATAGADDKKDVTVETVPYRGWQHNLRMTNGDVELLITLDVGPRVLVYRLEGGKNVFKEFEDQLGKSGEKGWVARGGHRLWTAPEDLTRTYAPDNGPVKYEQLPVKKSGAVGVRFTPAPDSAYGVQREMDVFLADKGSRVEVIHRITNVGDKPADLAPWALTMMAPGGTEVLPLPPKKPHPGPPENAHSPADYAAQIHMALWPYFDFTDPRWHFGSRYITLHQDAHRGPTKIGFNNTLGWAGYWNGGTLFVKRYDYHEGQTYADGGCNCETFTNQEFLEMESMGPLVRLAPGAKVEHSEHWELHKDVHAFHNEEGISQNVLPKVEGK